MQQLIKANGFVVLHNCLNLVFKELLPAQPAELCLEFAEHSSSHLGLSATDSLRGTTASLD